MTDELEKGDPVWYEIPPGLMRRGKIEKFGPFEHAGTEFDEEHVLVRDYGNKKTRVRKTEDVELAEVV